MSYRTHTLTGDCVLEIGRACDLTPGREGVEVVLFMRPAQPGQLWTVDAAVWASDYVREAAECP